MAVVGAVLPVAAGFAQAVDDRPVSPWCRRVAALVGAGARLLRPGPAAAPARPATRSDAVEALLVYLDLVTLERLANASATSGAATGGRAQRRRRCSARSGQRWSGPGWSSNRRTGSCGGWPSGSICPSSTTSPTSCSWTRPVPPCPGTLRARVRELRDAHLTRERSQAERRAEGMTIYMTLPALIFGLIFLVAALLTLLSDRPMNGQHRGGTDNTSALAGCRRTDIVGARPRRRTACRDARGGLHAGDARTCRPVGLGGRAGRPAVAAYRRADRDVDSIAGGVVGSRSFAQPVRPDCDPARAPPSRRVGGLAGVPARRRRGSHRARLRASDRDPAARTGVGAAARGGPVDLGRRHGRHDAGELGRSNA